MGLGGHLTWTAVFRELKHKKLDNDTKILPCEIFQNKITKIISNDLFSNNPHVYVSSKDLGKKVFAVPLNLPQTNYCKRDTPQRAFHRYDKHIIAQICEFYGIESPVLKCELYFIEEEHKNIASLVRNLNNNFIVIEPHSKMNYTPNRVYPFEKWQSVVDEISKHAQVVQVGRKGNQVLSGVVDFTGKTSFKEAALLIGKSKLFVSTEGGLVHAATAVDTKSVVVMTGYQDKKMVAYPQNINIDIANHGPCGLKVPCKLCQKDAESHDYKIIVDKIMDHPGA